MTREEIEARHGELVARHGEWSYDIPLGDGFWTRGNEGVPHTRLRRVVQAIDDLAGKALGDCRVLDLACLDGQFSIECALQGASVVGIEAREANLAKARFAQEVLQLPRLEFVQDDVRNVSVANYGTFDAVICSGILYHLDAPDVFELLRQCSEVARRLLVLDTHVTLRPNLVAQFAGRGYHGERLPERHATPVDEAPDGPPPLKSLWASVGNDTSFLFSRPSLLNALADVGFSSVHECLNPPHLNYGGPGIEHRNRVTFVAVKRRPVVLKTSPAANELREEWPEGSLTYAPERRSSERLRRGRSRLRRIGSAAGRRLRPPTA